MMGVQLGITLWGFGLGYREAVDLAQRAEDAGFHNLFMVEGVLSNDGVITVAMVAARTSRLLIGTNIANVYLRHPMMLGMAAVAIDEIAPGRLILGLGPNNQSMITQAGFTWRDPREAHHGPPGHRGRLARPAGRAGCRHPGAEIAHPDEPVRGVQRGRRAAMRLSAAAQPASKG